MKIRKKFNTSEEYLKYALSILEKCGSGDLAYIRQESILQTFGLYDEYDENLTEEENDELDCNWQIDPGIKLEFPLYIIGEIDSDFCRTEFGVISLNFLTEKEIQKLIRS